MNMKEHHIGIVVENIKESTGIFEQLGYQLLADIVEDPYQHNYILFMKSPDNGQVLELIQAMDEESTVKNCAPGMHHICYEVENKEQFKREFKEWKLGKLLSKEYMAPAIENRKIMFACLKNGLFTEFLFPENTKG